jgi:hypothetical protein
MNIAVMLVALFAVMGLVLGLEQAMRRVRAARRHYQNVMTKKAQQSDRLRLMARESLNLGREVRNNQRTADVLIAELVQFDEEMQQLARPENRVFVLDEKRGPIDRVWIICLESAGPQPDSRQMPPWVGERRFRVWASDEAGARAKVERRYPPDAGYNVLSMHVAGTPPAATPSAA